MRTEIRRVLDYGLGAIALASGVAQLAEFPTGVGRMILQAVLISCVFYFAVSGWLHYFRARTRELQARLDAHTASHQRYLDAIERISDRETPLFRETLELTVTVGADDDSDLVVERRRTTPNPQVTHLTMRPIIPFDQERVVRLDEIHFSAKLHGGGTITALPLRERTRMLRVWLVFDPALTGETTWEVAYRPKGLWSPLRERGWDRLGWDDRHSRANDNPSALASFVVRFLFPRSDQPPSVKERKGYGISTEPERHPHTDGWLIVWRDDDPAGRHYEWDLNQTHATP
jgi:hypothetical protein